MTEGYARYDYAWKTAGWNVQNPTFTAGVDTYVEPGLPADVSTVRVFGSFLEWDTGRDLEGVLRVRVTQNLVYVPTKQPVMKGEKRLRFRHDGFSIMLPATDDPQLIVPGGGTWLYHARLTVRGDQQEFDFALPAITPEVNIFDLIPITP